MHDLTAGETERHESVVAARPAPSNHHTASHPVPAIQCDHASMRLGGRTIWRDVTLHVHAGEFITILGPNGAGKSTLLAALLGVLPLSEGQITIFGERVRRGNPALGYLPQRRTFDTDVRIRGRDLVRLGLDGTRWGIPLPGINRLRGRGEAERAARHRVDEVLAMVGASGYADRAVGEASGGEQQRLLIAQALIARPQILLLDEPLDSLDLANQQSIAALIQQISQQEQMTVLLVAHDVNPILPYVSRVVYLANGQVAIGTPKDVITADTLSRLYGAAIEVLHARDGRIVVVGQPEEVHYHA